MIATPAAVPDTVTNFALVSADILQITFEWDAPYNGGSDILSYRVYWDEGDLSQETFVESVPYEISPDQAVYTIDSGLEAAMFYRFKVTAVNEIGESLLSASSPAFIAAEVPTKPLNVREVLATKASIQIAWDAPLLDNGSDIVNY